jgi:hypothetical protein
MNCEFKDNSTVDMFYDIVCQVVKRDNQLGILLPNRKIASILPEQDLPLRNVTLFERGNDLNYDKIEAFAKSKIIYLLVGEMQFKRYIFAASLDSEFMSWIVEALSLRINAIFKEFMNEYKFFGEKINPTLIPAFFQVRSMFSILTPPKYKEIRTTDEIISDAFNMESKYRKRERSEVEDIPSGYMEVPIALSTESYIPNSISFNENFK